MNKTASFSLSLKSQQNKNITFKRYNKNKKKTEQNKTSNAKETLMT